MDWSLLGFEGLWKVENIHPLFVHFPIALLPSSLLLYGLGGVFKKHSLLVAGRACLYLSFLSMIPTVISGLQAQAIPHNEKIHRMIETHKLIGLISMGAVLIVTLWTFWQKGGRPKAFWLFVCMLALVNYGIMQNGDIGSRMVYVEGAAVKPAYSVIAPQQEHDHEHNHHHATDASSAPHEHEHRHE